MFSHIFVGVTDFHRALAFYTPLMAALGQTLRFCEPERPWAGWQSSPGPRPLFLIGRPFDGHPQAAGNGQMTAFLATSRAQVDQVYAVALAHGALSEGAPGLRPEYHVHYYGAYFRDLDGNKLCVACHELGLLHTHGLTEAMDEGYTAMAVENTREADAQEWCQALSRDMVNEAR